MSSREKGFAVTKLWKKSTKSREDLKDSAFDSLPEEEKVETSRNQGQNKQKSSFFMQQVLDLLSFLLRKTASAEILFAPRGSEHLLRLRNLLLEQDRGLPKALETI